MDFNFTQSIKYWKVVTDCHRGFKNMVRYFNLKKEFSTFSILSKSNPRFSIDWKDRYFCYNDNTSETPFDQHYIYHTAWAARIIARTNPKEHVDISSSLYFCSIVSAFVPVKFYDFRPANLNLTNLSSDNADIIRLPFEDGSIESLSCMHTVEHIGLGRYGDHLDPDGDLKAMSELCRILMRSGNLLFVVPIGKSKIMFNAHRIYSYDQIMQYFKKLKLQEFSLISCFEQNSGIIINATKDQADLCDYGCGCFWFTKE